MEVDLFLIMTTAQMVVVLKGHFGLSVTIAEALASN